MISVAVDIGASSGRLIKGQLEENQGQTRLVIEEVHRFKNGMHDHKGHDFWDLEALVTEVEKGLKKVGTTTTVDSVGVDTWGVDYVLLDAKGNPLAPVYAYRDHRTDGSMERFFKQIPKAEVYEKTGIQFLPFNTLYQLFEHVQATPEVFGRVRSILLVPDYLHYCLSGQRVNEFTNATTTQMLNAKSGQWDEDLMEAIGVKASQMAEMVAPGTPIGRLLPTLQTAPGLLNTQVVVPATHDTGSAVVAVPSLEEDFIYISSGTWSLMGIENNTAICTQEAYQYNFTNEGGVFGTYRFLKNIMGLWMIQEVKRLLKDAYTFPELVELAEREPSGGCLVNPNDPSFLNPDNMIQAIECYAKRTHQQVPSTPGAIARCIFDSLACSYRQTLDEIQKISGRSFKQIHIIGGGAYNTFLNQLTADRTGCTVHAGPGEATAIGNIMMQMVTLGAVKDLKAARQVVANSFDIQVFQPKVQTSAEDIYPIFLKVTGGAL